MNGRPSATTLGGVSTLLAFSVLVLSAHRAVRGRVDPGEHDAYQQALQRAEELDARLNADIAESRLGIVTHYDTLVATWRETMETQAVVEHPPLDLDPTERAVLAERFRHYRDAVADKGQWVETFKTDQAVLRNSVRLLPSSADRLSSEKIQPALRAALERLLRDVLILTVDPAPNRVAEATCDLEVLGAWDGPPVCPESAKVEPTGALAPAIVRHAKVVVARRVAVEGSIVALMDAPVPARIHELREAYATAHEAAVERQQGRVSSVVLAAGALLVFAAATVISRLHASARALRDTTARLGVAVKDLHSERDRVVELADTRSRFVSMTSHEFRTPLSVILSSADLLDSYGAAWDQERRKKHLVRIRDAALGMTRMLDRVLMIGRAEAGMLEVRSRTMKLDDLTGAVVEETRSVVGTTRRLEYVNETPGAEVTLDEGLLRHVLINLLSNAFKYSPEDTTVQFRVRAEAQAVHFEVSDEGIGIPEGELGHLFEPFHRCANALGFEGTGLGLAVVKRSLEVHGGTIAVRSEVGRGTSFSVSVPFGQVAA